MGSAQGPPLNPAFTVFEPSEYGAHAQIFDMERSSQGGLWFATFPGVIHYDGNSWQGLSADPKYHVIDLEFDSLGRIWMGGKGGIGYVEVGNKKEQEKKRAGEEAEAPSHNFGYVSLLNRIPDSLQGGLNVQWVHTKKGRVFFNGMEKLFVLDEKGIFHIHPRGKSFYSSYEVGNEVWILERHHGFFKIPSRKAIEKREGRKIPEAYKRPGSGSFGDMAVRSVLKDVPGVTQEGELLVITRQNGIYKYRYREGQKGGQADTADRVVPFQKEHHPEYINSRLYHATPLSPEKNPWNAVLAIGTLRRGTILLDSTGEVVLELDQAAGMPSDIVIKNKVTSSKGSKALWACTNKGIARWLIKDPRTYARTGQELAGGVEDLVRNGEGLWASSSQGLYLRRGQRPPLKEKERWERSSSKKGQSFDLLELNGAIYMADGSGGCYKAEYEKEKIQVKVLSKTHTYSIDKKPLEEGDLIIGGGEEGIYVLRKEKGKEAWERVLWIKEPPQGILSLKAHPGKSFLQDGSGGRTRSLRIWVGLWNKGGFMVELPLSRLMLEDAKTRNRLTYEEGKADSSDIQVLPFDKEELPEGQISVLRFRDRIVLGSDSGIYRPERRSKKVGSEWRLVPDTTWGIEYAGAPNGPGKGNELLQITNLAEGPKGKVWINTSKPYIERLIPNKGGGYEAKAPFLRGMGMGAIQGFYPDSNGVTWIAANQGVIRYDESVQRQRSRNFPCLIREVRVGLPGEKEGSNTKRDSILFAGSYRTPAPKDPLLGWKMIHKQPEDQIPSIPFSRNALSFRYAAPFLEKEEALRYKVKLDGFEERWGRWTSKTRKAYNYLPEGSYSFKVRAKNVYGVESEVARYRFRILPPWYRTWTAYGSYTLAGIGLIGFLIWLNSRRLMAQKRRLEKIVDERTKEIREQKEKVEEQREIAEERREKIEEAHKEITDSIDYAQKIQYALLQSEEHVSPHLPEHFILLKPQSQVSGDFYWTREHKGHLYIAAVDCTGHGVPGAFMSMLGISQLNEIMNTEEVPSPGKILTELRERVVRELSGSDPESAAKDGMDAALVRIPFSNTKSQIPTDAGGHSAAEGFNPRREGVQVQFAGAQNPLYVIRKGIAEEPPQASMEYHGAVGKDRDPSVQDPIKPFKKSSAGIEIKGDSQPVGHDEYAKNAFTTVELSLQKGDMCYIFSDGYADQFGGPKGKKFRYGPFKQLLMDLHEKPLEEQKQELDQNFEDWKAESGQEQIDDVVVIGVRL